MRDWRIGWLFVDCLVVVDCTLIDLSVVVCWLPVVELCVSVDWLFVVDGLTGSWPPVGWWVVVGNILLVGWGWLFEREV